MVSKIKKNSINSELVELKSGCVFILQKNLSNLQYHMDKLLR